MAVRSEAQAALPERESQPFAQLLSLLTMFDFHAHAAVSKADWERGCDSLCNGAVDVDAGWEVLARCYDNMDTGVIALAGVNVSPPIDPRVHRLLQLVIQAVVRLSEQFTASLGSIRRASLRSIQKSVNLWKDRLLFTTFGDWKSWYVERREHRRQMLASMYYAPCRMCLRAVRRFLTSRKQQRMQAEAMGRHAHAKLLRPIVVAWRTQHRSTEVERRRTVATYRAQRNSWTRRHTILAWHGVAVNERKVRLFAFQWWNRLTARIIMHWRRLSKFAAAERSRELSRCLGVRRRRTQQLVFHEWRTTVQATNKDRHERGLKLMVQHRLVVGERVARAWFVWKAEQRAKKEMVRLQVSLLGYAWRGWLQLLDAKRLRMHMDWLFGPDLGQLKSIMQSEISASMQRIEDSVEAIRLDTYMRLSDHANQGRRELSQELRALRELMRSQLHQQVGLIEQKTATGEQLQELRGLLKEAQAEVSQLRSQTKADMDKLAASLSEQLLLTQNLHAETGGKVQAREDALERMQASLVELQRSKADHAEIVRLISTLERRSQPSHPMLIEQLNAVYPLPPTHAPARRVVTPAQKSGSQPEGKRPLSGGQKVNHLSPASSVLREVRTHDPRDPALVTSEQILVHSFPESEMGQRNPSASGRIMPVSPVMPRTCARPQSARATSNPHIANFNCTTERLLRKYDESLGGPG